MNTIKFFKIALCLFLIPTLFVSCTTDDSPKTPKVTEEESAEIIGNSLQGAKGGLVGFARKFAQEKSETDPTIKTISTKGYDDHDIECGVLYEESFVRNFKRPEGVLFPLESTINTDWSYKFECGLVGLKSYQLGVTTSFDFLTRRIKASGTVEADIDLKGLAFVSSNVVVNGSLKSSTSSVFTGALRTTDISSDIDVTLTDVVFDKTTFEITSGTGTASIYAKSGDNDVSYSADIVFNNDNTATITINGFVYVIEELIPEEDL